MKDRCYFGCEEAIYHTLLELPPPYSGAPDLCRFHSDRWNEYRDGQWSKDKYRWPESFWPWADKTRKEMKETTPQAPPAETRPNDTEILASEAVPGFWYTVGSGEVERCVGQRNRGRGVQVGFVGIADKGNDPDEIRWLQGRTSILVASEVEAAKWMRAARESKRVNPMDSDPDLPLCPRNGLLCPVCELPQHETPGGAVCAHGHGGAPGLDPAEVANRLAQDGYTEEARAVLDSVPPVLNTGEPEKSTLEAIASAADEIPLSSEEASEIVKEAGLDVQEGISKGLEQLAARTAGRVGSTDLAPEQLQKAADALTRLKARTNLVTEIQEASAQNGVVQFTDDEIDQEIKEARADRRMAGPSAVFHKSLHIDWRTPKALFDALVRRWGPYWLDAAAMEKNKLCEFWLGPGSGVEDALSVDWIPTEEIVQQYGKNIFLNHPYSPGEEPCKNPCTKKKCPERGYCIDQRIASSGEWMEYARNQAIGEALKFGGVLTCLTKHAGETGWWEDAVRKQPESVGAFVSGRSDPDGGPAAEFMAETKYKAATWLEFRWEKLIVDIVEIKGRVDFDRGGDDGSAGFPSAIVTYYRP